MRGQLIPRSWLHDVPRGLFRDFADLNHDLDTLFDRVFGVTRGEDRSGFWPSIESYVKDGALVVRTDLPGVDPKGVDVSVADGTLTIRGERKGTQEADDRGYRFREVRYGGFERRVRLPAGIDPDKITARYTDGVLEITLALPSAVAPRKVQIETDSGSSRKAA